MAEQGDARALLSGATRVAGVIGAPVRHSRSPQLMNAAFEAARLDWAFVALEVAPGEGAAAVAAMRTLGLGGLSVTMPHKHDVIAALDRLSDDAAALDAVNCIAWDGDELVGHNTDGAGLVRSLGHDSQVSIIDRRCVVLGAGGAARSVIRALARAGAAEVMVVNRTAAKGAEAAALAGEVGRVGEAGSVGDADLIINATSVGMGADEGAAGPLPVDGRLVHEGQVVVDLVYQPLETPLLAVAREQGAHAVDGLGMLVHQAALAIGHWTGHAGDTASMGAAARR